MTIDDDGAFDGSHGKSRDISVWDGDDKGLTPLTVHRTCTDPAWLFVFLVVWGLFWYISVYAFQNGDITQFSSLQDFEGHLCGRRHHVGRPYLYFCMFEYGELGAASPICVESCPSGTSRRAPASHRFPRRERPAARAAGATPLLAAPMGVVVAAEQAGTAAAAAKQAAAGVAANKTGPDLATAASRRLESAVMTDEMPTLQNTTFQTLTHQCYDGNVTGEGYPPMLYDYDTNPFIGMLCKPINESLFAQLAVWKRSIPPVMELSTFYRAWEPLVSSAVLAVLLSYLYIMLLQVCASIVVWIGLIILTVVPSATGACFLSCAYHGGCGDRMNEASLDLGQGMVYVSIGLLFGCLACRSAKDVSLAIECITDSCRCIMGTGTLRLTPVITLCFRSAALSWLGLVTAGLLTCGIEDVYTMNAFRRPESAASIAFVLFAAYWSQYFITATSDFVVMYTTQVWFFAEERTPRCIVVSAYRDAFFYHLGTLIVGALTIGLAQPFRILLGVVTAAARVEGNPVGGLINSVCCCLVDCYEGCFDSMCKQIFLDVTLNALPLCGAIRHSEEIKMVSGNTAHVLNGATWLFQLAGLGSIGALGHLLTFFIVSSNPAYSDEESPKYVENGMEMSCYIGTLVAVTVSWPFMMLFDTVSDTILYCRTVQQLREARENGPPLDECSWKIAGYLGGLVGCNCGNSRPWKQSAPRQLVRQQVDVEYLAGDPTAAALPDPGGGLDGAAAGPGAARLAGGPGRSAGYANGAEPLPPPKGRGKGGSAQMRSPEAEQLLQAGGAGNGPYNGSLRGPKGRPYSGAAGGPPAGNWWY